MDFQPISNNSNSQNSLRPLLIGFVVLVIVGVAIGLGYLYVQTKQENDKLRQDVNGVTTTETETSQIRQMVKELITVSSTEALNIAPIETQENLAQLKQQNPDFYKDAIVGQYLVVMPDSKRVLIFDKDLDKIINFSSYTVSLPTISESEIPDSEKPLSIEIRYTDDIDSATLNGVVQALQKASSSYDIISTESASNNSFTGITVVLLNKAAKPNMSQNIVSSAGSQSKVLEQMPDGEATSSADVVIILGRLN